MSLHQQDEETVPDGTRAVGELRHRALRREVNEQIHRINRSLHSPVLGTMDVMCECIYPDCMGLIVVPMPEYEAIRSVPGRYLVKAGHDFADGERVVAETDGHVTVETMSGEEQRDLSSRRLGGIDAAAAAGMENVIPLREATNGVTALSLDDDLIEQAKRAVSVRFGITTDEAFELVRGLARSQNRSLPEYAAEIVARDGRFG